jgi:hypothetical protein
MASPGDILDLWSKREAHLADCVDELCQIEVGNKYVVQPDSSNKKEKSKQ